MGGDIDALTGDGVDVAEPVADPSQCVDRPVDVELTPEDTLVVHLDGAELEQSPRAADGIWPEIGKDAMNVAAASGGCTSSRQPSSPSCLAPRPEPRQPWMTRTIPAAASTTASASGLSLAEPPRPSSTPSRMARGQVGRFASAIATRADQRHQEGDQRV